MERPPPPTPTAELPQLITAGPNTAANDPNNNCIINDAGVFKVAATGKEWARKGINPHGQPSV